MNTLNFESLVSVIEQTHIHLYRTYNQYSPICVSLDFTI